MQDNPRAFKLDHDEGAVGIEREKISTGSTEAGYGNKLSHMLL